MRKVYKCRICGAMVEGPSVDPSVTVSIWDRTLKETPLFWCSRPGHLGVADFAGWLQEPPEPEEK